jgi:hypothetical protein
LQWVVPKLSTKDIIEDMRTHGQLEALFGDAIYDFLVQYRLYLEEQEEYKDLPNEGAKKRFLTLMRVHEFPILHRLFLDTKQNEELQ